MKSRTHRRRPVRTAPTIESLEARALLSRAGSIDLTFGNQGYTRLPIPMGDNSLNGASAVAFQPDGKVVLVENLKGTQVAVTRLISDGSPDTTFGVNGTTAPIAPSPFTQGHSMLLQADGKILVAGSLQTEPIPGQSISRRFVERLNADGSPDTSFGTAGIGIVTLGVGAEPDDMTDVKSILPGPNGTILLAGDFSNPGGDFSVVRLNSDGSLDKTFGFAGQNVVPGQDYGAALQSDGKIVLAGSVVYKSVPVGKGVATFTEVAAVRLNSNGSLDTSFGGPSASALSAPGMVILAPVVAPTSSPMFGNIPTAAARSVAIQPDGKIVLAGDDGGEVSVIRLGADGVPDAGFGNNAGREVIKPPVQVSDAIVGSVEVAKIAPGGKIVVLVGSGDPESPPPEILLRLNTDGSLDPAFGDLATPGEATFGVVTGNSIAIQPDGKIVVAGTVALDDIKTPPGFAFLPIVARFLDPTEAIPADYDGSGKTDLAVYLTSLGEFAYRPKKGGPDVLVPFGLAGPGQTIPAPGNYSGVGKADLAAYLPSLGLYAIRPANGSPDELIPFGFAGPGQSIPSPGDYQGTGRDNIAVYLPSIGSFAIRSLTGGPDLIIPFGFAGAGQTIPAPGDYFGVGQSDVAAYLPSLGAFAIRDSRGGSDKIIPFGLSGVGQSIPVPGDYDGSGKTELAVYLPSLGDFVYRPANGGPDVIVPFGSAGGGSIPVPGDYDGSGKTEVALYDPRSSDFAYRPASGPDVIVAFGAAGQGQSLPAAAPPGAFSTILPPAAGTVKASSIASRQQETGRSQRGASSWDRGWTTGDHHRPIVHEGDQLAPGSRP